MGSLATFKTTYLATSSPVLTAGQRGQLAGPVNAIDKLVADGMSVTNATAAVLTKRTYRVIHRVQRDSGITPGATYQGTLVADFIAINAA